MPVLAASSKGIFSMMQNVFLFGNVIVVICNFLVVIICLFILNIKGIDVWLMCSHLSSIGSGANGGALFAH